MEASREETSNNASAAENVVQARDVQGGVHIHNDPAPSKQRVVPHQLPATARHFINRTVEQDALTTLLNGSDRDTTVLVSTVDGLAGVGKSALVVRWAQDVRERFPDGQLYVNLRGFDPAADPLTPAEVLTWFLTSLGVAAEAVPADQEARAAQFRTLLHDRHVLIVLDNARDTEQVLPLLPGSPGSLVVVTSRQRLDGLIAHHGAHRLALTTLTGDEGRSLLAQRIGADRLADEPEAVEALLGHCAGLPLALTLVAVQAAAEPDTPLADLAADLSDERDRLDALDAGGRTGIRAVFSWSYRSLSSEAASLFRQLGLSPCPDSSLTAAAALAGLEQRKCRRILAELTRLHLLTRRADHYVFHDLLRAYARERAYGEDSEEVRTAAQQRLLDHYFHAVYAATEKIEPAVLLPELDGTETKPRRDFSADEDALAWWDAEHANVAAVIRQAASYGMKRGPWLAHITHFLFKLRGLWDEWETSCVSGLKAARAGEDRGVEARLLLNLASIHFFRNDHSVAIEHGEAAAALFAELDDRFWEAISLQVASEALIHQGRYAEAVAGGQRTLELLDNSRAGSVAVLERGGTHIVLGLAFAYLNDSDNAFEHLAQALDIVKDGFGRGFALDTLAFAYLRAGRSDDAVRTYEEAVECCREVGHRWGEARGLDGLGSALRARGDAESARQAWQQALSILDDIGHPNAETVRAQLSDIDAIQD